MRKTVYIVPKETIPTVFAATKKMVSDISERHYKYLGISEKKYEEISKKIMKIIKGKGMSTKEIKNELKTSLNISPIINLMCDQGYLIRGLPRGGWKSNMHIYYPFIDYFPDIDLNIVDEIKAKETVVYQYLNAFGPSTENNITWWTGFKKGLIKQILRDIQDKISYINISNYKDDFVTLSSEIARLKSEKPLKKQVINLLPWLDPYIMGYKDRERYLDQEQYNMIFDRSGNATSTILHNGKIIGVWDIADNHVKIFLFDKIKKDMLLEIQSKAKDIGMFICDKHVKIKVCKSMIPLNKRTAGGFMSPLKLS